MKKLISTVLVLCVMVISPIMSIYTSASSSFTDVGPNAWYLPAVSYCVEKGFLSGVGQNRFNPTGEVTRAQVTQTLYNKEGRKPVDSSSGKFVDVANTAWYRDAVTWCSNSNIISGTGVNTFGPEKSVTRQDLCLMTYRYVKDYLGISAEHTSDDTMAEMFIDWNSSAKYAKDALCWANESGFMKGTSSSTLSPTENVTRGQLARFIYNLERIVALANPPDPTKVFKEIAQKIEFAGTPDDNGSVFITAKRSYGNTQCITKIGLSSDKNALLFIESGNGADIETQIEFQYHVKTNSFSNVRYSYRMPAISESGDAIATIDVATHTVDSQLAFYKDDGSAFDDESLNSHAQYAASRAFDSWNTILIENGFGLFTLGFMSY